MAGCELETYDHSSIISYGRIVTSSDVKFSNKLTGTEQHKNRMLQNNGMSFWSHTWLM